MITSLFKPLLMDNDNKLGAYIIIPGQYSCLIKATHQRHVLRRIGLGWRSLTTLINEGRVLVRWNNSSDNLKPLRLFANKLTRGPLQLHGRLGIGCHLGKLAWLRVGSLWSLPRL